MSTFPAPLVPAGIQISGPDPRTEPSNLGNFSGAAGSPTTITVTGMYRDVVAGAEAFILNADGSVFASGLAVTLADMNPSATELGVQQITVEVADQFPLDGSQPVRHLWLVNNSQAGEPSAYVGSYRIVGLQ